MCMPLSSTWPAIENLNFRYRIEGDHPAWRPYRAFDDGRQVFIEFPSGIGQGEMPPLWIIGSQGGAELVNYRVRRNYYIVDRLFALGVHRVWLDTLASNERARRAYLKAGFEVVAEARSPDWERELGCPGTELLLQWL